MKLNELIAYEVTSSWWAGLIPTRLLDTWVGLAVAKHFVRKAKKKFRRYQIYLQQKERK